ncbi:LysR family transcriptional regulator [Phenylobacterium sp.]|uniref:LysR family transcriptional regulator n=1 Tax=Phenylobacterium sp. TaxID=1871053 RepID=UPI0012006F31|nr:LysR family transcriptional regulator [Phenylobacterium sp.]THD62229.1 MAG: LysR family transcriptional regulator [Phenylobacterium sp.]
MDRIDLGALDHFAAVARHGNFRRAAVERGVSASTLSQALRDLEARLGVRLLNRTTRSVAMTDAGAALLASLQPALAQIAAAVDEARSAQDAPSGALRINAPEPAVALVLAPLVADFLAAYPAVRLEIIAETSLVDIVAKGFDAGVRWSESLAQDMVAVPLGPPQRYVVAAAPQTIARWGAPAHPRELLQRPCLRVRFPSGAEPPWEFERGGETLRLPVTGPLVSNSITLQMQAALDGAGFLQTMDGFVADHLASGRLMEVLADWSEPFPGPLLYYPSRRHPPSALGAFVAFIQARRRREGW